MIDFEQLLISSTTAWRWQILKRLFINTTTAGLWQIFEKLVISSTIITKLTDF